MAHGKNNLDALDIPEPSIIAAMGQPPPPCDVYACDSYEKCKHQKLACESFRYYVSTGKAVHPGMAYVAELRSIIQGDTIATHKMYNRIMASNG